METWSLHWYDAVYFVVFGLTVYVWRLRIWNWADQRYYKQPIPDTDHKLRWSLTCFLAVWSIIFYFQEWMFWAVVILMLIIPGYASLIDYFRHRQA